MIWTNWARNVTATPARLEQPASEDELSDAVRRAVIREAAARGEAADRDHRLTMIAVIGAVNNLVHHWSARDQNVPLDDITAELTHLIVAAVTTP